MITKDPVKRRAYDELREKDLALFALLAQLKDVRTETNTLRAKERHLFTDRLREMTDSQRQITKDLLDRGMAPYIITNADRDVFAAQIERELGPLEEDIGVGAPRDSPDDDDRNADQGDYGDHTAQSNRERDQDMPEIDEDGPI
jgi:ribosomal protein S30